MAMATCAICCHLMLFNYSFIGSQGFCSGMCHPSAHAEDQIGIAIYLQNPIL
jgi:hypothetical protein